MKGGGNFLIVKVEKLVRKGFFFFVFLHSFFYFILSILSNDQNVAKPVYWADVVETRVVREGELIKRNRKQRKLLFRRMKSISALSATPYSHPILFGFIIFSDLFNLVFFSPLDFCKIY